MFWHTCSFLTFKIRWKNIVSFLYWPENVIKNDINVIKCHKKKFGEGLGWELTSGSGSCSLCILKSSSGDHHLEMMDNQQQRLWYSCAGVGWCYHHCSVSPVDDFFLMPFKALDHFKSMSQLFSDAPQVPETSTQCWKIEHALKQMGKQTCLIFSSFLPCGFLFFLWSVMQKIRCWGFWLLILVTEELEELPTCWRVVLEE